MSLYSSFLKQLGLAKESVRGTAEAAPVKWVAVTPDSELIASVALLDDPAMRGVMSKYPGRAGLLSGSGSIKFPLRASDIGEFLHMLAHNPATTEQTAFVVSASNNKIDFKEDGGGELTATLANASYAMGTSSGQVGTLCAEIKSALEVAGAGTYTVTYSYTTRKVTIAVSGGVTNVQILWLTGTNTATSAKTLLGFSNANTANSPSVTSDSTTSYPVFSHSFVPATQIQPQSYSMFMDRGLSVKAYNLCNVSTVKFTRVPDQFINFEASVMFKTEAAGSIGSPSFADESKALTFQNDSIQIAASPNTQVKQWEVTLTNGLFAQKTVNGSQSINDLLATNYDAEGTMTVYFENETERAKFMAGTETSIQITITGDTITGAQTYKIVIDFDSVQYSAYPFGVEDNLLAVKATWRANYSSSNSRVWRVVLTNRALSY